MNNSTAYLNRKGFTIIELIVVIAILGFVAYFVYPTSAPEVKLPKKTIKHKTIQAHSSYSHAQNIPQVISTRLLDSSRQKKDPIEVVNISNGVEVTFTRSRTTTRTISITEEDIRNYGASAKLSANTGVMLVKIEAELKASIQKQITHTEKSKYQDSETKTYSIKLDGKESNRYELIWVDTWRKGIAVLKNNKKTYSLPFEIRTKTELTAKDIADKSWF